MASEARCKPVARLFRICCGEPSKNHFHEYSLEINTIMTAMNSVGKMRRLIEEKEDFHQGDAGKNPILRPSEDSVILCFAPIKHSVVIVQLPHQMNCGDYRRIILSLSEKPCRMESLCQEQQTALLRALIGECPVSHYATLTGSNPLTCLNKGKQMNITGCNTNKHKETMPRDTARRVSSFVVSTIAFLGIFFNMWSQFSLFQFQPLRKERDPPSIWSSLLGLLGFMLFVWAVAIMIIVDAPFTRMHSALLVLWAILMLLQSGDSINAVFVPILGIFFMGFFACGKVEMIRGKKQRS